jgi:predicted negative regulator of RcsB-dependent stress response
MSKIHKVQDNKMDDSLARQVVSYVAVLVPFVVIGVVFWFRDWRPYRRQKRENAASLAAFNELIKQVKTTDYSRAQATKVKFLSPEHPEFKVSRLDPNAQGANERTPPQKQT